MEQAAAVLAKPGFRRAAANLGWLLAGRAVRFGLAVIVGFVVARHLGPARLGTLSYCTALVTLAGGLAALGLDAVVKRDLLTAPGRESVVLASAACLRLAAGFLACALLWAVAAPGWLGTAQEGRLLVILGLLLFQPAALVPDLWLQAHLRARSSVVAQTIALAAGALLRVVFVVTSAPLAAFAAAVVIEAAVGGVVLQALARRRGMRLRWTAVRVGEMKRLLAEAWPLMFAGVAIVVYMKIDEIMLRRLSGATAVGIYAAATRLTEIWYFVPTALASSVLPALLRARGAGADAYRRRFQQYFDVSAGLAYGLAVPMVLAAPWLVRLAYGPAYAASAAIVTVHIWSSVFVFLGIARGQWLVNERRQVIYLAATLSGAGLNIGLNLVFIPRWGGLGAAAATVLAQAVAAWLSSFWFAATREVGWMQLRALLVPLLGWRYFSRRHPAAA